MNEPSITCPNCKSTVKLTESLAAPLIEAERKRAAEELEVRLKERLDAERGAISSREAKKASDKYEAELKDVRAAVVAKDAQLAEARELECVLRQEREQLAEQKRDLELNVQRRLDEERDSIRQAQAQKTRDEMSRDLKAVREDLADKDKQLTEAKATELELRRDRKKLTEEKEQLELTVERRMDEEREKVRDLTRRERDEQYRLKMAEKERVIADMQKQLDEAQRKAEQGSQQTQGDVAEKDLESLLRAQFPHDEIEPVGKGREGGDRVQRVLTPSGQSCGSILWERKRTRNWSSDWLEKARDDQRAAKANVVVIVSDALPRGVVTFDRVEGVWVASSACAMPLAVALRQALTETAMAHRAMEGRQEKESLVYVHVTGPEFRQRIGLMVEAILSLRHQHEKEKAGMRRIWAEREKQFDRLMSGTAMIYGGFRGIVGATLPEIKGLSLPESVEEASSSVVEPKLTGTPTLY